MVAKLPLPDPCSVTLVGTVVLERANGPNAGYFNGLEQEWRERVEHYLAERGNPETIPNWQEVLAHRTRFLTLYESPQEHSVQFPILKALRDRQLQMCPSCGEEGTPNTLDHYLPKRQFPHFSITPANLTPMCDICQGIKGVQTLDDDGHRIYLHPYFDDFLAAQVLRLVIGTPYCAPEDFVIEPDLDLPDDIIALVQRHIDGLELQRRYGAFFRDQYMRLLRLAQICRSKGTDIREDIPKFKKLHEMHHANVWPHLFYAAVSEDQELLDYLAEGELPDLR
jgi:5-methylcytosine-specific restriction endonuclease McrA